MKTLHRTVAVLAAALAVASGSAQTLLSPTFTYQGRLDDAGQAVNGMVDITFSICSSAVCDAGGILASQTVPDVDVVDGLFAVELTFPADALDGQERWLDVVVEGQRLCPRQALGAAPYAVHTRGLWVDSAGNVGVKTESPAASLHVGGTDARVLLQDDDDPDAFSAIHDSSFARLAISKRGDPSALIDIDPIPLNTSMDADVRFFRETNTTGRKRMRFYRGNGSIDVDAQIGVDGQPTYFAIGSESVGIGTAFPSHKLDVSGSARITGELGVGTSPSHPIHAVGVAPVTEGVIVANAQSGSFGSAVMGQVLGSSGYGVTGFASGSSGTTVGVLASNNSSSGVGLRAACSSSTGATRAVHADVNSPSGWAVYAEGGRSFFQGPIGIGTETTAGLLTLDGSSDETVTIRGFGSFDSLGRIRFQDNAGGVFIDNPTDGELRLHASGAGVDRITATCSTFNVSGTLSKGGGSFKIDHPLDPENKYLFHSFVESPDMMNIYNGNVVTDENGYAVVTLPEWFEALNRDFRYQLTVIDAADSDAFVQAKVVREIEDGRFTIRSSAPHAKVSWQVTGVRQDAWANANRIPVEVDKTEQERGLLLHPEAFGERPERGIGYVPSAGAEARPGGE